MGPSKSIKDRQQHVSGGAESGVWQRSQADLSQFFFHVEQQKGQGTISWADLSTGIQDGLEIFFLKYILFGLNISIDYFYSLPPPLQIAFYF